jgi:hypothetical protein
MGIVLFQGDPPYELFVSRGGKATAQGEIVRLTLPVSVPGPEPQEREIELLFRFGHAFGTAAALQAAATQARKQARDGTSD